jgi:hypothetical protein
VDRSGRPVAFAHFHLASGDVNLEDREQSKIAVVSAPDGSFTMQLPPGHYRIYALTSSVTSSTEEFRVSSRQTTRVRLAFSVDIATRPVP